MRSLPPETARRILLTEWWVRQARKDPAVFAEFAFWDESGRPLRLPAVHRELHTFLSDNPRALVELPRDHGKTTQVMIRILWELGRNPNLRVLVVCASGALAAQRGRFLRDAIARNVRVRRVFPTLVPDGPWSVTSFGLARPGRTVSPSVAVLGIGASTTGARADLLVCDDVVDVKSLYSATIREKTKQAFRENLVNLLEPGGRAWLLFTPWHAGDLNAELKRTPGYNLFRRAVGDDLEPVWPEKWPRERLAERRAEIGESSFARAFRLQTLAEDDCLIRPEWVQYWTEDPGVSDKSEIRNPKSETNPNAESPNSNPITSCLGVSDLGIRDCFGFRNSDFGFGNGNAPARFEQIILAIDPAVSQKRTADASALITLGKTSAGRVHCLEAIARRVAAPDLVDLIADADSRWRPDLILFEANAAFQGIKDLLTRHARFGSKVKALTQSRDKHARVSSFSVRVQNGAFLLRGAGGSVHPGQRELLDEMLAFPVARHDDLLDAAAFGTAYLLDQQEPRMW